MRIPVVLLLLAAAVTAQADAFVEACRAGDLTAVRALLDQGVPAGTRDAEGETGLGAAANRGQVEIVRLLLERGADVHARGAYGATALLRAAQRFTLRRKKLRRASPEQLAELKGLLARQVATVEALIAAGADLHAADTDGETPLEAALDGRVIPVAKALLSAGADANRDGLGARILGKALTEDDREIADLLLAHKVTFPPEALAPAVEKNRTEVALHMIRGGVDVDGKHDGAPLLVHAAQHGNVAVVSALLQAGADVNATDDDGATALQATVRASGRGPPVRVSGMPDFMWSSQLRNFERSSGNYIAVAEALVAAGATTGPAPEVPPALLDTLTGLSTRLARREFKEALTTYMAGDSAALVAHPKFKEAMLPVLAELRSMLNDTARTRSLWSRGVYPRGVPKVVAEGNRAVVDFRQRQIPFELHDGVWKLRELPVDKLDKIAARRKVTPQLLQEEFRVLHAAGFYEAAAERGREVLALAEGLDQNDRYVATWALANTLVALGDYAAAEKTLAEAAALIETGERLRDFRWLVLESAVVLASAKGEMDRMLSLTGELHAELVRVIAEVDFDNRRRRSVFWARLAQTYGSVGAALSLAGRHDEGRAMLQKALRAVSKSEGGANPIALYLRLQLAGLYTLSGQTESAKSAYAALWKKLERTSGTVSALGGQVQSNLGAILELEGHRAEALAHIERALEIGRAVHGDANPEYGLVLLQHAGLQLARGENEAAAESFAQARAILEASGSGGLVQALTGLATCRLAAGRFDEAAALLDRAQDLVARTFGPAHRNMASVHAVRAELERRRGRLEAARSRLVEAVGIVERERGRFRNDFDRRRYLGMVEQLYGALAAVCLEAGLGPQAFEAVERHKSKSLLELLATRSFRPRGAGAAVVAAIEELDARARHRGSGPKDLAVLRGGSGPVLFGGGPAPVDPRRHELLQRLRELNPELASLVAVSWPSVADVQAALDDTTVLVEFHAVGPRLVAFVVGRESFLVEELAVAPAELAGTAEAFVRDASDKDSPLADVHRRGRELYDRLFRPLGDALKAKTLVVVPYGKIHYVPLGALRTGDGYLGERYRIVRAPSAGVFCTLRGRAGAQGSGFLALADPASYLPRLPGAREEVQRIARHFEQAEVHAGAAATEHALSSRSRRPPAIFHFAGHGVFDERAPELSHLALAPGAGGDGRLEVHEIHGLDLTGTRLVVLSACQGATGAPGGGDEIVGLVRPFLASGAGAVVASLWNVSDAATMKWMVAFYDSLAEGAPPAAAVQRAQAEVAAKSLYRHPYFWAAFQLYGAPTR